MEVTGRSNSAVFLTNDLVALGADSPDIQIYSISDKTKLYSFQAHERRVRCMKVVTNNESVENDDNKRQEFALVTASNDGWIKVS